MKYDDAEFYFLDFTTDLPNENGGRHIGLFLEWAILRGLASEEHLKAADALRSGKTNGVDYLFDACDGKLMSSDLNAEGNLFVSTCYRHVLPDFIAAMNVREDASNDEIFGAELTQQRHDRILWELDKRFGDFRHQQGMPGKEALSERVLAVIEPAMQAAGFPPVPDGNWGSHSVHRWFGRKGAWGSHGFTVVSEVSSSFYGVRVEFAVEIKRLADAIYREKEADIGNVTAVQPAATIPFERFAEGWNGPMQVYDMRSPGFWIFHEDEIEPLATWLAERLRRFAVPVLRGLDGVDAIALALGTKPMAASPIYDIDNPYTMLLAAEMARHPRLGAMLDEVEQALHAVKGTPTWTQKGSLALIKRIRARSRGLL
jgi:hypothetical protein